MLDSSSRNAYAMGVLLHEPELVLFANRVWSMGRRFSHALIAWNMRDQAE
jgi:hypothetical protein